MAYARLHSHNPLQCCNYNLNLNIRRQYCCFYSSVPAEAVTIANEQSSFQLMNRKVKSFKQCFYRNSVRCQKLQQVFAEQSFGLDTGPQVFSHSFIALLITRCSKSAQNFGCVESLLCCCYGNHAAGSKPI